MLSGLRACRKRGFNASRGKASVRREGRPLCVARDGFDASRGTALTHREGRLLFRVDRAWLIFSTYQ